MRPAGLSSSSLTLTQPKAGQQWLVPTSQQQGSKSSWERLFHRGFSLSQRLSRLSNSYQLPGILNIKQASRSSRATPLIRCGDEARATAEPASMGRLQLTLASGASQPRSTHKVDPQLAQSFWHRRAPSGLPFPAVALLPCLPCGLRAAGPQALAQPRCRSVTRAEQDRAAAMPREPPRHRITRCSPTHSAPAGRGCSSLRL